MYSLRVADNLKKIGYTKPRLWDKHLTCWTDKDLELYKKLTKDETFDIPTKKKVYTYPNKKDKDINKIKYAVLNYGLKR